MPIRCIKRYWKYNPNRFYWIFTDLFNYTLLADAIKTSGIKRLSCPFLFFIVYFWHWTLSHGGKVSKKWSRVEISTQTDGVKWRRFTITQKGFTNLLSIFWCSMGQENIIRTSFRCHLKKKSDTWVVRELVDCCDFRIVKYMLLAYQPVSTDSENKNEKRVYGSYSKKLETNLTNFHTGT